MTHAQPPSQPDNVEADTVHSLLAAIVASSNDAIIGKNLGGIVTSWNGAAEKLLGFTASEMIGQSIMTIIPIERRDEEGAILERVRRGEQMTHFETERLTKDFRLVPVSLTISPIRNGSGEIVGVSKIARDLTGLQQLNSELKERQELFAAVLRTVPDGLIVIDGGGVIQSVSPAVSRLFQYQDEELVGQNMGLLIPGTGRLDGGEFLARYLATGQARISGIGRAVQGRRKDGSLFPMELEVGEVLGPRQQLFTGFVRDLSMRQERERRLAELQSDLIHLSRLSDLGQTVSALAHEVNQPLAAITAYVSGIRRMLKSDYPPELGQTIEKVARQAERASQIVNQLRVMIKKGDRPKHYEDLRSVIEETADLALAGCDGEIAFACRTGEGASHAWIDRVQIQQVLFNLLRNAVQALENAPVRVIDVITQQQGGMVEIRVKDSGPGLSALVQERLFEPFLTTKPEGLGVGLSICRKIVEGHGGHITVTSRQEAGCVFSIQLPVQEVPPVGAAAFGYDLG